MQSVIATTCLHRTAWRLSADIGRGDPCASQVNYKNVMKQYNLGPNGGILTALNLFATRFDQARASAHKPKSAGCGNVRVSAQPRAAGLLLRADGRRWPLPGARLAAACTAKVKSGVDT